MSALIERLIGHASLHGPLVTGYRKFGVPWGGAFDQESYLMACALVGNTPNPNPFPLPGINIPQGEGALAVELANGSLSLQFSLPCLVAVVGPDVLVEGGVGNGSSVTSSVTVTVGKGGYRAYVMVPGGFVPEGIDSLLGRAGRVLSPGDVLGCGSGFQPDDRSLEGSSTLTPSNQLRVIGFEGETRLVVSNTSDRTGIRLDRLGAVADEERISEPACMGAIQRTPSGQLIVIGPDGPTIGGYPKVGFVCTADLDRLAQLRPGHQVSLVGVSMETAKELASERKRRLAVMIRELVARTARS